MKGLELSLILITTLTFNSPIFASDIPWSDESFSYFANGESVAEIIQHLADLQGVPVNIEGGSETVNASFHNTTRERVFQQLVRLYGLRWFYDGRTLYVDDGNNAVVETIELKRMSAAEFRSRLMDLNIPIDRFYWHISAPEGLVMVGGPQGLVRRIVDLAHTLDGARRGFDTVYRWTDANGQTHFSTDGQEAPGHANVLNLRRTDKENTTHAQPSPEASVAMETDLDIETLRETVARIERQIQVNTTAPGASMMSPATAW